MKEYAIENEKKVDLKKLVALPLSREAYAQAHQSLPLACHDVFIEYQGGILLVVREDAPAQGVLWTLGGRISRGVPMLESLKQKVKEECGLDLDNIVELGAARTWFRTAPFGHGQGTDSVNWVYFARGRGNLKLDKRHKKPIIIKPADYTPAFRKSLHPYVLGFMDKAMKVVER